MTIDRLRAHYGSMVGARGLHPYLVTALGAVPRFHWPALITRGAQLVAAEAGERRNTVVLIPRRARAALRRAILLTIDGIAAGPCKTG